MPLKVYDCTDNRKVAYFTDIVMTVNVMTVIRYRYDCTDIENRFGQKPQFKL